MPANDPKETLALAQKFVRHGRYVTFQLAGVASPGTLFVEILGLIDGLRPSAPGILRSCSGVDLPLM